MSRPAGESDDDEFEDDDFECFGFTKPTKHIAYPAQQRILSPNDKLFEAVNANDVAAAEAAIAEGADVNCKKGYYSAIIESAIGGHFDIMELLIQKGADVNDEHNMSSVIMWVCQSSSRNEEELLKCFKLLQNHGADISKTDWLKSTCLIHAVRTNHPLLVASLIENGCDINAANCDGYTAIAYAVEKENLDLVKLLIEKGADTEVTDRSGERLIDKLQVHTNEELAALLGVSYEKEVEVVPKKVLSPYQEIMLDAPNKNDRLHGYHTDAVRFIRGVRSHDVSEIVKRGNVQFGHVLTWNAQDWKQSGVCFSYYHKKIAFCVKRYHEHPWGKNAIPNASKVVTDNEVDLFLVVLFFLDFLRVAHISSTTSLYILKNWSPSGSPKERLKMTEEVKQTLRLISAAKKHIEAIERMCIDIDSTTNSTPPDLITRASHKRNPTVKLLVYRVVLAFVFELRLLF